jgi:hypothetical protein
MEILICTAQSGLQTVIEKSKAECEKFVLRLRESRQGPDSITDEEVDRLYLLGEELFDFEEQGQSDTPADLAHARAREAKRRIESRQPTSQFNPGPKSGSDLLRPSCHAP